MSQIEVCVGRIGKAHGVRGEVSVEVRTDEPERRFVVGARLLVRSPASRTGAGPRPGLPSTATITGLRRHQDRLLLTLEEVADRTAAEASRGALLYAELAPDEVPDDPEEFYDHQLVGLAVEDLSGIVHGSVVEVQHNGGQDLLVIHVGEPAREALVPFVQALVPVVDLAAGRIVVDDRPGLLDGDPT